MFVPIGHRLSIVPPFNTKLGIVVSGYPWKLEIPIWFSGNMGKG